MSCDASDLSRCVQSTSSSEARRVNLHWERGNRVPGNLNYSQQGGDCLALRTETQELISRWQPPQDLWDSASWNLIYPSGPFHGKRNLLGKGLMGLFSLLGGIHHGNMTFTAPLHLLIKGIHKQSTLTLVTRSQQSWWWDHTMWHNAHNASFKQRAEPHTKLQYVLCRYLGFDTVSAFLEEAAGLHRSRITQIYKQHCTDVRNILYCVLCVTDLSVSV